MSETIITAAPGFRLCRPVVKERAVTGFIYLAIIAWHIVDPAKPPRPITLAGEMVADDVVVRLPGAGEDFEFQGRAYDRSGLLKALNAHLAPEEKRPAQRVAPGGVKVV